MNGRIHGKQIKDESIRLSKFNLSGGQLSYILGTGSHLGAYEVPSSPFQYTNKEYVDSVAAGLDPKQSSRLIHTGTFATLATGATYTPIGGTATGTGHTITFTGTLLIDSVTASVNDRIVINVSDPSSQPFNGIYVLTDSTTLTRSSDFDGTPNHEVNGGEFVFITEGNMMGDTGWVVSSPNQPVGNWGVTPIIFTQFSSAGVLLAGDGLIKNGNIISVDLASNSGLTFSGGDLTVGTSSTITVNTDNIEVRLNSLTASRFDIVNPQDANQNWRLAYNNDGRFVWLNPADSDISEVVAGAGLTGGGASGSVTLDIISGNAGIVVNTDSIELTLASTTDNSLTIQGGATGGLNLDRSTLSLNLVGNGLTQSAGVISTNASFVETTVGLSASLTPSGSSIQTALTALDNQTMVSVSVTGMTASGSSPVQVGTTYTIASDGYASIYINGLYVRSNGAVYFSPDGVNNKTQYIKVNDKLWVVPSQLLYDIETDDNFFVEYYTLHT